MKTYLTLSAIALAAAATLSSGVVMAADPAPAPDFVVTGNFGITSDYRFRGISQNDKKPALQGGLDVAFKEGFYLGTWASKVADWTAGPNSDNMELDLYGGYKTEVNGVAFDVGAIKYYYPGSKKGGDYLANT
ncbi:MAG: TorF family putative porin, partial [Polynucleobacter victoriensis]